MIKFYYHPSPNPAKVALFLEEAGLPYEMVPVDTRKGDQFKPEFLAINPNAKTPALTDGEATIFDSNAILLYLAEKTGQFLPEDTAAARGQMLSWLMFVATGIGPYCGQAVHFSRFAPEKIPYAINRYAREAERHWGIIEAQLAKHRYMLGDRYTLVDMSVWGWATRLGFALGEEGLARLVNVKRHFDEISARPAAQRAVALKDQFAFKTEFDEEARRFLFPQNAHLAG
jgi:GST-like protein